MLVLVVVVEVDVVVPEPEEDLLVAPGHEPHFPGLFPDTHVFSHSSHFTQSVLYFLTAEHSLFVREEHLLRSP